MLLIAFMLNILKIRFDFLCSDTVLSKNGKKKHSMKKPYLSATTLSERGKNHFRKKITSHKEMDADVWKLGNTCMNLSGRNPAFRENDLNSSIC
jgi:hypothetical protein